MRRIAIALTLVALVAGFYACSADAPTTPKPGNGGGSNALQIQLFTNNANPKAGTCTLVEAIVSLNGNPVPDGTSVAFSADFGTFSQNGLPLVSVVTQNGTAVTALCGPGPGTSKLKASVTVGSNTGSATLTINFQPDPGTGPFVSSCNPSFGNKVGGDTLVLNGGRFFGTPATTRVQFTANGITREGIVTAVAANAVTVTTPGFPELNAPTTPAAITLTLGTNLPTPTVVSLPSCFAFGTADSGTPTITAILPASGTNEGNTRVTIVGSGFASSGVQVFFGAVEATVVSVSFNQIVVLSPPAFGGGQGNLNQPVQVTVKNISSGVASNGITFTFTPAVRITGITNNVQSINLPFTAVTIFGQGFQAPVAVTLAGVGARIQSVSATELVVIPGFPLLNGCTNIGGAVVVTNLNSGDTADGSLLGLSFLYLVPKPVITSVSPNVGSGGTSVLITGVNLPTNIADADVKFGGATAFVDPSSAFDGFSLIVTAPPGTVTAPPACTGTNPAGTLQTVSTVDVTVTNRATQCSVTAAQAFSYQLACVVPTPAAP